MFLLLYIFGRCLFKANEGAAVDSSQRFVVIVKDLFIARFFGFFVEVLFYFHSDESSVKIFCSAANSADASGAVADEVTFVGVCTNNIFASLD